MKNKFSKLVLFSLLICFLTPLFADTNSPTIYQTGIFLNMMNGILEGSTRLNTLMQNTTMGLGTIEGGQGELIIIDKKAYLGTSDGSAHLLTNDTITPFAMAVNFAPTKNFMLDNVQNMKDLETKIDQHLPSANIFYAMKIEGTFNNIEIRDFDAPVKPYVPFDEWLKTHQHIYNLKNVTGTIVIFKSPNYINPISVPGYHMHFIDAKRNTAGHVFDVQFTQAKISIEPINNFFLLLPNSVAFLKTNLKEASPDTIKKIESKWESNNQN